MIVPRFWAEGRIQEQVAGKQITVRRYGWSDDSPLAAQVHADQRTREAFDRIASGEKLNRRERKQAYNGADGVPIREEIVERQGDTVITRNSYGARCLNTPDVLFVDIDFDPQNAIRRGIEILVRVRDDIAKDDLYSQWIAFECIRSVRAYFGFYSIEVIEVFKVPNTGAGNCLEVNCLGCNFYSVYASVIKH